MILQFNRFWRKCGVRLTANLVRPPVNQLSNLRLPINSHFHYTLRNGPVGLPQESPLVEHAIDKVVCDFVVGFPENMEIVGKHALISFIAKPTILEYHAQNPELRRLFLSPALATRPKCLMVTNYNLIDRRIRYHNNPMLDYIKFYNYWKGVFINMNKVMASDDRNHFFFMELPEMLPSLSLLLRYERGVTREVLNKFNSPELLMVGEFWNWLNGKEKTIFNFLNKDIQNRLTIIVTAGSKWTALRLDVLNSWVRRKDGDNEKATLTEMQLSRRCLNLFMEITSQALEVGVSEDEILDGTNEDDPYAPEEDLDGEEENFSETADDKSTKDFEAAEADEKAPQELPATVMVEPDGNASDEDIFAQDEEKSIDEDVDRNLELLEKIHEEKDLQEIQKMTGYSAYKPSNNVALEDGVLKAAQDLADKGKISPSELRRYEILSKRYLDIPDPYGQSASLAQAMTITEEDTKIEEHNKLTNNIDGVLDQSMLDSSLDKFDRNYIQKVMRKDIMQTVLQVQRAGIAVQDYQVQKHEDMDDAYEIHTVKLIPVGGKPSTVRFRVPIVDESGIFKTGGVKSRMRKQRADVPIRKVGPDEVALTSYYAKMFVKRTTRSVFNYEKWISQQLTALSLDEESVVEAIQYANCFIPKEIVPRVYSQIARRISSIRLKEWELNFDVNAMNDFFGEDIVKTFASARKKQILVGKNDSALLVMLMNGQIVQADRKDPHNFETIGYLETLLGLNVAKRPLEMVELDIYGKTIPLGIVLAFHLGLGNLLETIKADYRKVPKGIQLHLEDDEFDVRFSDMTLVFKRTEALTTLLMSGFNLYHKSIKPYSVYQFDNPDVYGVVFEENKLGIRYVRELDMIRKLWCDHITAELLVEMREPTDMVLLYLSAVKKLLIDAHPPQMSLMYQRDRGYERFSGMAYSEITRAVRSFNSRPSRQHASVDVNPQAIWLTILQDQTKINIEESNPIHSLKEQEIVVFRGAGGRSARSMTAAARVYDESGIGVVSDATVDNGDAGTLTYLTANPNYRSVRGTIRETPIDEMGPSRYLGTSTLLAAGAEFDDPKRRNFISIQNSRTTNCESAHLMPCRTGYERVLAYRTNSMYAKVARKGGEVVSVNNKTIVVRYEDGTDEAFELGTVFGTWSGKIIPHTIETGLKPGHKFKEGDLICYNTKFFTVDQLGGNAIYKPGVLARTVLVESTDTLEDSSAITSKFASKLGTAITHVRNVTVSFDQEIHNLLKVGDHVDFETILCTIYNPTAGNDDLYSGNSLELLKSLGALNPKAQMSGVIEKIEVIYAGDVEDMCQTLQDITNESDTRIYKLNRRLKRPATDGRVQPGRRVSGKPLEPNTAVIQIYMTHVQGMGVGDKLVVAHQMKSVIGRVISEPLLSEDGVEIDTIFGYDGLGRRVVLSAELIGTTNTILKEMTMRAVAIFDKD